MRRLPPPYPVCPPGTPGPPPTDPPEVARFLFLRALEGGSNDEVHASLCALPQLARKLGFRKVPAAPTVAELAARLPPSYLEQFVGTLARELYRPPENVTVDGTGLSTRRYERWITPRPLVGQRHAFVKLHALVATRFQFPFFLTAHVTDARTNDVTKFPDSPSNSPGRSPSVTWRST